uniref:RRM domain-containing protein n=1 Tax=Chlamydomonas euryale TaxID=1486919 RepID=A0A7R9VVZ6_9CHLO
MGGGGMSGGGGMGASRGGGGGGGGGRYELDSTWGEPAALGADLDRRQCQVVVQGLPFAYTARDLTDMVVDCGTVLHARIPADDSGRSKGWGMVLFNSPSGAAACIDYWNRREHKGRTLAVKLDERA